MNCLRPFLQKSDIKRPKQDIVYTKLTVWDMIWTLNKYTESQEKQKMKNLSKKAMRAVNGLAEVLIKQTANSACLWAMYQPQFPKEAEKFKQKNQ